MMRILITGGNGYVGRALTRLLARDHAVRVVDALRTGPLRFRPNELRNFEFAQVDIRDSAALTQQIDEYAPTVVIHLAAMHFIPECEAHPDEAIGINTLGTANVLRALNPGTRFVLASTAAVYAPETRPHDELDSIVGPLDVYGLTKLHAEEYTAHFAAERDLDARIVRLFNVVGPGETNPHLLPAILAQVRRGNDTLHLGNTTSRRDYVHVDDVAHGFATVSLSPAVARAGEVDVVNLGTGVTHSADEIVDHLRVMTGRPLRIETDPERVRQVDRPFLAAGTARMRQHYRFAAAHDLDDALRDLLVDPDISAELLARS